MPKSKHVGGGGCGDVGGTKAQHFNLQKKKGGKEKVFNC